MEEISCMQYFPTLENTPLIPFLIHEVMKTIVVNYYPRYNFYMYNLFSLFFLLKHFDIDNLYFYLVIWFVYIDGK